MKVSQKGLDLIKKYEGFYPNAYKDVVDIVTIGWGTTKYANGKSVKMGDNITESEALKLLELQVNQHASSISTYVKVELNQNQFDALASFQYNLGKHILKGSKLLEYINAKNWNKVAETMKLYNKAGGKVYNGLVKRRASEVELFLTPIKSNGDENMSDFICPIDNPKVTSVYGMRLHPVLKVKRLHAGIDLVSSKEKNPPVHATCDGTVRIVKDTGNSGYGKYVIITHNVKGVKYETVYAHLKSYSVKVGQKVKQGEVIGILGNTGIGTGDHLHYEVHKGTYTYASGTYPTSFDPMRVTNLKNTPSTLKINTSPTPPKGDDDELKFSSPALEKLTLDALKDKSQRKLIVDSAIKLGASKTWLDKHNANKMTDGDYVGLAIKYLLDSIKK